MATLDVQTETASENPDKIAAYAASHEPSRVPILGGFLDAFGLLWKSLRRNLAGLIGFLGLVFYFFFTVVGPLIVPFDGEPKLDAIAAPPGSRMVLVTRSADADRLKTIDDFGPDDTLGYIDKTGGQLWFEDYEASLGEDAEVPFDTELFRFRSGRGVPDALEELANGEADALIVFSETVKQYLVNNDDEAQRELFSDLSVSNDAFGPSHILGTDTQGRDIFSHIVNGGASLIFVAMVAGIFSTVIAVTLGSLAAMIGGPIDRFLVSSANFVLTIPQFPLLVVLAVLVGQQLNNPFLLAGLIAILSWPVLMRAVRAQVLSLREREFVEAARSLGLGLPHIVFREILPNMMSFVAINFIFAVTSAMYQQIGLIFLGMAPINDYTWGVMLFFGRTRGTLFSADSMSMVLSPVVAIALFQVSMVLFARALEEMFDPRLRTVN
ncbi:ABC transporter permease subunit [Phototrophicus methaneseepsis]|uniref:ABC transporter permease subunit n=1 Tax=Phototrophicus methaneseepsis TaxID=2710758 RepID=A0A7S8EBV2_9CHLR|nr:ABC transporter permease subunit [Phototrophicus methaneseepsis]QPC84069.1 ABC transporter permease subunit [Phototrophicus methaneseepsis]